MHIMWYTGHAIGMLHSYDENLNFFPARKGVDHCHTHITHLTCQMHHWISDSIKKRFFILWNDSLEIAFFTCLESYHTIRMYILYMSTNLQHQPGQRWCISYLFFFSLIVNWNVKKSRKSFWKRYKLNQFLINLNPVCCSLKLNKVDTMLKCEIQRVKKTNQR